jgi:hypothetical protein
MPRRGSWQVSRQLQAAERARIRDLRDPPHMARRPAWATARCRLTGQDRTMPRDRHRQDTDLPVQQPRRPIATRAGQQSLLTCADDR